VDTANGHLLLMPSEGTEYVGVKIASVTPGNPARGLPRIQAGYLLFDGPTLTPRALLDGAQLTSLRTPALSGVAGRYLAHPDAHRLVVFGTGPQAHAHVEAMRAIRPIDDVAVIGRDPAEPRRWSRRWPTPAWWCVRVAEPMSPKPTSSCAPRRRRNRSSTARSCRTLPVCSPAARRPDARELDTALMSRGYVVVEDAATALRETGDVIRAVADGALRLEALVGLAEVVTGRSEVPDGRPRVFTSVGMAWEDLAVAAAVYRRWNRSG
jgi:ornithine cyclodeaminase